MPSKPSASSSRLNIGARLAVTVSRLDEQGAGVAELDSAVIHAQGLLPGEAGVVTVAHVSPHRNEAWATLSEPRTIISPDRRDAACPAFGVCGGCHWQELSYPAQLVAKRQRVEAAFAAVAALPPLTIAAITPSPQARGYRNKGKYVIARHHGQTTLGGYAPRSHNLVPTVGCAVVMPIIDELAAWSQGILRTSALTPYLERTRSGDLRYLVLRANHEGLVHATWVITSATWQARRAELLTLAASQLKHPALVGVLALVHDRADGSITPLDAACHVLGGQAELSHMIAGVEVATGPTEFLQVNTPQAEAMYRHVAAQAWPPHVAAATPPRVIDLYAGLGGISLHLARRGAQVVAIERDARAMQSLTRLAAKHDLAIQAMAGEANQLADELSRCDAAVVNPPRKGLDALTLAKLGQHRPPRLVYVSCGPEALARDAAALLASGYDLTRLELFDLMPDTAQIETVATFVSRDVGIARPRPA